MDSSLDGQIAQLAAIAPPPKLSDKEVGTHILPCLPTVTPGAGEIEGESKTTTLTSPLHSAHWKSTEKTWLPAWHRVQGKAVGLGDDGRIRLCHQPRSRGISCRAGHEVGSVVQEIDSERAFSSEHAGIIA